MSFAVLIISSMCGMMGGVAGSFLWFKMRGSDPKLGPEVDALRDDLDDARGQLADMQEHTPGRHAGTPRFCRTLAHRWTCIIGPKEQMTA